MSEVLTYSAARLHEFFSKGELSPVEVIQKYLDRFGSVEDKIRAFLTPTPEAALAAAERAEQMYRDGAAGPLTGVPMGFKDVLCTRGVRTTCGSKILENFVPIYDAHVVERLIAAGAVCLGKLNMDEFAMGSSTENSAYFPTHNPWDLERIPGGSSGGSAASVAARECVYALGSDTGGSIRQPASHCGVVGLKPTYGRVSRYGLVAFASSLDQIGPLCRDVTDVALVMNVIAGYDRRDSTSVDVPVPDYTQALGREIKGLRLGIPREYFVEGMDPEVERTIRGAIDTLVDLGAEAVDVSLPHTDYGLAVYYIIAPAEASSNLARYDGVRYGLRIPKDDMIDMYRVTRTAGFGAEVQRRIIIGTYALSAGYYDAYYGKASQVRTLLVRDFKEAFDKCDVLVTPTAPTPAFKIGEKTDDPVQMYLSDVCTLPINLAGIPGLSVPAGLTRGGLPIGVQFLGPHFAEERLLNVGRALELARGEWTWPEV
jgi:aspartyl-tRNA(Asn)/glutamyl-tRNA(Gln) amidotransferase subunit A